MKSERILAYSKKKIILIGDSGFLSKELKKNFKEKKVPYKVIKISRKNNIQTKKNLYEILNKNLNKSKSYTVINCLASLKPKNKSDIYVNESLPMDLLLYLSKGSFVVQFSSNNVLVKQLKDNYSLQKKKAEENILKIVNSRYVILRLPFLLPSKNFNKNEIPKQFKLLMRLIDLPLISFIPPSRNIYRPINIQEVVNLTTSEINSKTSEKNKIININGKKEMNLLDISKFILSYDKKKKNNILFQIPFPWKILDFFLHNFSFLLELFEKKPLLQQFLPIKR